MRSFVLLSVLAACHSPGSSIFYDGTDAEPVRVIECTGSSPDPFQMGAMTVASKQLRLMASYGGGCNDHVFAACWDGRVVDSSAELVILHEGFDDSCDAFITREVVVDLSQLPFSIINSASASGPSTVRVTGDQR
jgi:hypothetical protein